MYRPPPWAERTHTLARRSLKQVVEIIDRIRRRRFTAASVYIASLVAERGRARCLAKKKKKNMFDKSSYSTRKRENIPYTGLSCYHRKGEKSAIGADGI